MTPPRQAGGAKSRRRFRVLIAPPALELDDPSGVRCMPPIGARPTCTFVAGVVSALGGKGDSLQRMGVTRLRSRGLARAWMWRFEAGKPAGGHWGSTERWRGLPSGPSIVGCRAEAEGRGTNAAFGEWCDDGYRRAARINSDMSQRSNVAMRSGVLLTSRPPPCERTDPIAGAATLAHPRPMTL